MDLVKRQHIVELLQNLAAQPDHISLSNLNKQYGESTVDSALILLELFNVIEINEDLVTVKSEIAAFFISSLAEYLAQNFNLITSWKGRGDIDEFAQEELFDWGVNFLQLVEKRRVNKFHSDKTLDQKQIALFLIKAKIKGREDDFFLFQYNTKSLQMQLIGGYLPQKSVDPKESATYFLHKELSLNSLKPETVEVELFEELESFGFSPKRGVYTKYEIKVYSLRLEIDSLKLSPTDRWLTLAEMAKGITLDGISVRSPIDDVEDKEKFAERLKILATSFEDKISAKANEISPEEPETAEKVENAASKIEQLLTKEETENIEFKSSVRWDYKQEVVNKALEKVIVKTIAGFLNSKGGSLLIGVSDEKEILGITNDMNTLQKKNEDGFMQLLISLISENLGIEFCSFVKISFAIKGNKKICLLEVNKASQPVFVRQREEREFYIRAANTTRQLNAEEVYKYIQMNW